MTEPTIERRNGVWYMILGDEASPMDGTISGALNAKVSRMAEAQRRAEALGQLAEMDGEFLP